MVTLIPCFEGLYLKISFWQKINKKDIFLPKHVNYLFLISFSVSENGGLIRPWPPELFFKAAIRIFWVKWELDCYYLNVLLQWG